VVAEFVDQMKALTHLSAELTGTIEVGERSGQISGLMEVVGDDHHQLIEIEFGDGSEVVSEMISIDDVAYTLEASVWMRSSSTSTDPREAGNGLGDLVQASIDDRTQLRVVDTDLVGGVRLYRLEMTSHAAITPATLGIDDASVTDFEAEVAFLAEDDGTPVGMVLEVTWVEPTAEGTVPGRFELEYRFDRDGPEVAIEAPTDVWELHASEQLGYQMIHPAGWMVQHEAASEDQWAFDLYLGPVDDQVQVYYYPEVEGATAEEWFRWSASALIDRFEVEPQVASEVTLGNGTRIRVLTLHAQEDGSAFYFQEAVVFAGDDAWDVDWYSFPGGEVDDGVTFMKMLLTFERTG
jgi:hypothetical protein